MLGALLPYQPVLPRRSSHPERLGAHLDINLAPLAAAAELMLPSRQAMFMQAAAAILQHLRARLTAALGPTAEDGMPSQLLASVRQILAATSNFEEAELEVPPFSLHLFRDVCKQLAAT